MYLKALPILIFSGLIAGAAISNADAAPVRRVPMPPQYEAVNPWIADNADTAIDLQSDSDVGHHDFGHHDLGHDGGRGGSHGGHR